MIIFNNEEEMIKFGEKIGHLLKENMIITLTGELGAGKTTLTKGIGKALGVTKIINSPTYTIVKEYEGSLKLYHFDAYRLEDSDDDLGFEEMFEDGGVCVIEWPMFIDDILPKERLEIEINKVDQKRSITFHPVGERYKKLVEEIKLND